MAEKNNATCAICGKEYYVCNTCRDTKIFKPWRTIADSIDCYKIYMTIYDYRAGKISKEEAKNNFNYIILPETFQDHIKKVIDEIMEDDASTKDLELEKEIVNKPIERTKRKRRNNG